MTDQPQSSNPIERILKAASKVEANEIKSVVTSFLIVLIIMTSYYLLRPVRDALASDWTDAEVATLWTINFGISFIIVAIYGAAVSRISLKNLVPSVYVFFAVTFVLFYFASSFIGDADLLNKAFYIWISVFSLFPVSVFWSLMADTFNKEQSKRLFAIIATGASIGAMLGPTMKLFVSGLEGYNAVLVSAVVLLITLPLIFLIQRLKVDELGNGDHHAQMQSIGGNSLEGYKLFLKSKYLLGIGLFLFLYTGIGSFIYFELKNLMTDMPRAEREDVWAFMDLATNSLTIITGLFLTSRLTTKLGMGFTLALLPVLVLGGLLSVAMVPLLSVVVGLQVFRRAGNYAISRPAREMLFTNVDRETRYKAKQIIDVVVYRGGDTFWGWAFTGLTSVLGLGVAGIALVGAGVAGVWAWIGLSLGKQFDHGASVVNEDAESPGKVTN